jgi:hypothetical protein
MFARFIRDGNYSQVVSREYFEGRKSANLASGPGPPAQDEIYSGRFDEKVFRQRTFSHCTFANVSFKGATLDQCKFLNCAFLSCYFRQADITRCEFTGSTFADCRFPEYQLQMSNCKFDHVGFRGCFLPLAIGKHNLPLRKHNLRDELATNLALEAETAGASREARAYRMIARRAQEHYHRAVVLQSTEHYQKHHNRTAERLLSAWALARSQFNNIFWGYGERVYALLRSYVVTLLVFAGILSLSKSGLTLAGGRHPNFGDTILLSLQNLLHAGFLSSVSYTNTWVRVVGAVETGLGLLFVGLFITFVFRWIIRR